MIYYLEGWDICYKGGCVLLYILHRTLSSRFWDSSPRRLEDFRLCGSASLADLPSVVEKVKVTRYQVCSVRRWFQNFQSKSKKKLLNYHSRIRSYIIINQNNSKRQHASPFVLNDFSRWRIVWQYIRTWHQKQSFWSC